MCSNGYISNAAYQKSLFAQFRLNKKLLENLTVVRIVNKKIQSKCLHKTQQLKLLNSYNEGKHYSDRLFRISNKGNINLRYLFLIRE